MNNITQVLFWVSNSLLIPNIIILLLLFFRALILLGSFYNSFMLRRKSSFLLEKLDRLSSVQEIKALKEGFAPIRHSLIGKYIILFTSTQELKEAELNYHLNQFEIEVEKDLGISILLSKLGPVLGLIGTLISMSPALLGLSTGNIEGMAYNMQIVFATTVVGLVISLF